MSTSIYYREAPKVTVFLFAYNQERFIEAACKSILSQDYDKPIEIVFSDDCSQDNTFQIMTEIAEHYTGVHTLHLNRNSSNLGLINHINLSYELSTGDLIIAAAGDDISLPHRVTENVKAYRLSKKLPMSLYSSVYEMTEVGNIGNIRKPPYTKTPSIEVCAVSPAIVIGAAHAWHRKVFDVFGDIKELGAYEDLVIAYRSVLLDSLIYIDLPLVFYRLDVGISQIKRNDDEALKKNIYIETLIRHNKIMLPVLRQRLNDSLLMNLKSQSLIRSIKRKIMKEEVRSSLLKKEKSIFEVLRSYNSVFIKIFSIKSWVTLKIRDIKQ